MGRNRYLLVTRAGPESLHTHWLAGAERRNFDLFVSAYDARVVPPQGPGVHFEHRPGRKVAGYAALLREHRALWQDYDYVALFDDDLLIDAGALNRLFDLAQNHELTLAQPALSHRSHFTYGALLRHPGFALRFMTYIEMMCPVFRTDALADVLPLFDTGYESGIDIIWSYRLGRARRDMAVIDAVTVDHVRKVGTGKAANGFAGDRRYGDDIAALLAQFGVPWRACVPYEGVRRDGRRVTGPAAFVPDALGLTAAIPREAPMKIRARNIAVYWKHLLSLPAQPHPIAWPFAGEASELGHALGREPAAHQVEQP